MRIEIAAFVAVVLTSLTLASSSTAEPANGTCPSALKQFPCDKLETGEVLVGAGMVPLLANPAAFAGLLVAPNGVLRIESEGNMLFLDQDSRSFGVLSNGIALFLDAKTKAEAKSLDGKRVIALGTFQSGPCGHLGMHSACLSVRAIGEARPRSK